jgi:hypothetical protein
MINKIILRLLILIPLVCSCVKYAQPSHPVLSGQWRIDELEYMRIESGDTSNQIIYSPGDVYLNDTDQFPIDSIAVGFTKLSMDYASIRFCPVQQFDGSIEWLKPYFYSVTEVNYSFPGFLCFETEFGNNVWKIILTENENMILQLKGDWDPNSLGFFNLQSADNYDVIYARLSRVGP